MNENNMSNDQLVTFRLNKLDDAMSELTNAVALMNSTLQILNSKIPQNGLQCAVHFEKINVLEKRFEKCDQWQEKTDNWIDGFKSEWSSFKGKLAGGVIVATLVANLVIVPVIKMVADEIRSSKPVPTVVDAAANYQFNFHTNKSLAVVK